MSVIPKNPEGQHGNFGQLTLKREEENQELLKPKPPLLPKACRDSLWAWHNQPHLPALLSEEFHQPLPLSWPTRDCLILLWKMQPARCLAGRENSLMLGVGEVEQASVERLNNCINICGSPRRHAYTARGLRLGGFLSHFQLRTNFLLAEVSDTHSKSTFVCYHIFASLFLWFAVMARSVIHVCWFCFWLWRDE